MTLTFKTKKARNGAHGADDMTTKAKLRREWQNLTRGVPAYRVAHAMNYAMPGRYWSGCNKAQMGENYCIHREHKNSWSGLTDEQRALFQEALVHTRHGCSMGFGLGPRCVNGCVDHPRTAAALGLGTKGDRATAVVDRIRGLGPYPEASPLRQQLYEALGTKLSMRDLDALARFVGCIEK